MHYIKSRHDIYIPNYTSEGGPGIVLPGSRMKGEYRCVLRDLMDNVKYDSGWHPNLITDQGLVNMASSNWGLRLSVGTSATTPAITDTSLPGYLAEVQMTSELVNAPIAPDYAIWHIRKGRFGPGIATGLIKEIGANPTTAPSNTLMSTRALLAVPVNKAADQILDIYYKMWRYPDIVDRTGSINIEGVSYDFIVRGANLADWQAVGGNAANAAWGTLGVANSSGNTASTNDISDLENMPVAGGITGAAPSTFVIDSYGSGFTNVTIGWSINGGIGSIRSFNIRENAHAAGSARGWQVRIGQTAGDGKLVKDYTEELYLSFGATWARYP